MTIKDKELIDAAKDVVANLAQDEDFAEISDSDAMAEGLEAWEKEKQDGEDD